MARNRLGDQFLRAILATSLLGRKLEPRWWNSDADADGKAPFGDRDQLARVARIAMFIFGLSENRYPLCNVQPLEGLRLNQISVMRRGHKNRDIPRQLFLPT
jgi:hypothetical protein